MELRQYVAVIWRWLWLIVLGIVLAAGTAYVVSDNMVPIYRASATLLINQARSPAGTTDYTSLITSERLAKTYAELLTKRPVLEEVASDLGLDMDVEDEKGFPAAIEVQPVRDTQLLVVSVESDDPALAADIANLLPQVFIQQNETVQLSRFASSKDNLAKQLTAIEADIKATQEAIDRLQGSESGNDKAELGRLQSTLVQYQNSYTSLLRSFEEIRLAEAQAVDNVVVVEPAEVSRFPVRPRTRLNTLLAAVVGGMLAVGVAFLIEYLDDTLKSADDIRGALGLTTLGAISRIRSKDEEERLVASTHPQSPISEAYRVLRTNIQFTTVDRPVKTLLVTSPNPSEGKSTTVANLAVVMAQAGMSVVAVDSDLRRPVLHHLFNVPNKQGLTNALLQEAPVLDGCLLETDVENLRVMPSGPLPPNPSELLGSQRMKNLLQALKDRADVLLLDSPPTLAVTDAAVLANEVDGVVLVVDAGETRRGAGQRAVDQLAKVGANLLGVTLNKLSPRRGEDYYYYYYYYSGDGRRRRGSRQGWLAGLKERLAARWERARAKESSAR